MALLTLGLPLTKLWLCIVHNTYFPPFQGWAYRPLRVLHVYTREYSLFQLLVKAIHQVYFSSRIARKRNDDEDAEEELYSYVIAVEAPAEGFSKLGTKVIRSQRTNFRSDPTVEFCQLVPGRTFQVVNIGPE